jgi:hypothetical protein
MASNHTITLGPEQVEELNRKLANMRHNVNNYLALITAAAEIVLRKPESAPRLMTNLLEHPHKVTQEIRAFSDEFEKILGIAPK